MHKGLRKHSVIRMALSNLDSWMNSPRVLAMAVCMVLYCVMQVVVDRQGFWIVGINLPLTLPEKLFVKLSNSFFNMGSLLFLVMVSEVPRKIRFQYMTLIRSTRRKWVASQCLYCAMMVLVVMLLLCVTYSLMVLPKSSLSNTFTDDRFIAEGYYAEEESYIPAFIRSRFTPWSACVISALPMFFFWYTMVLVILLCSVLGHPLLGPSIYGFLLMGSRTMLWECLPYWLKLPTDFMSLGAIVQYCIEGQLRHLGLVLAIYAAVDLLFIITLLGITSRTDFAFWEEK